MVVRSAPPNPVWPFRPTVRESDLDPAYRATASPRRGAKRELALFMVGSAIFAFAWSAALSYLWPSISGTFRHLGTAVPVPDWSRILLPPIPTIKPAAGAGAGKDLNDDDDDGGNDEFLQGATGGLLSQQQQMWRDFAHFLTTRSGSFDVDDDVSNNWFADVDVATPAILTMWVAQPVPSPATDESSAEYRAARGRIEARVRQVRRARAAWERFQGNRDRVVAELIRFGTAPRIYIDGQLVGDAAAAEIERDATALARPLGVSGLRQLGFERVNITGSVGVTGRGPDGEEGEGREEGLRFEEQSFDTLRLVGQGVIGVLERAHALLFEDWNALQTHVQEAQGFENEFIEKLLQGSARSDAWTARLAISLRVLQRRVERVQRTREAIQAALAQIQEEFSGARLEGKEGRRAVMRRTRVLLHGWAKLVMDVQEGLLFTLRRREALSWGQGQVRNASTYEATWEEWKGRNCGGTSCYFTGSYL